MGDGRVDRLRSCGLGDGGEGVQHGGVGLPAAVGVGLHHVGQSSPRSAGVGRDVGERRQGAGSRPPAGTDPASPRPTPGAACGSAPGRASVWRAAATGDRRPGRAGPCRSSASSASLSWGQNSIGVVEAGRPLRLAASPSGAGPPARVTGRGGGEPLPGGLPDRLRLQCPASRPRRVRRRGPGRSRSRPCTGCTASPTGPAPTGSAVPFGSRQPGEQIVHQVVAHERVEVVAVRVRRPPTWPAGRRPARRPASPRPGGSTSPWPGPWRRVGSARPSRTGGRRRRSSPCALACDQNTPRYCNSASGFSSGGQSSVARKVDRLTPGR